MHLGPFFSPWQLGHLLLTLDFLSTVGLQNPGVLGCFRRWALRTDELDWCDWTYFHVQPGYDDLGVLCHFKEITYTDTYATNLSLFSSFFRGLNFYWKKYGSPRPAQCWSWGHAVGGLRGDTLFLWTFDAWFCPEALDVWKDEPRKKCIYQLRAWLQYLISMTNLSACKPAP